MQTLTDLMYQIDDFMWGSWMTVLILATGIILSIAFKFRYQTKIGFNFKNTFAKMTSKGEGEGRKRRLSCSHSYNIACICDSCIYAASDFCGRTAL